MCSCRELETREYVLVLEIGEVLEQLAFGYAGPKIVKDIVYSDSHRPERGLPYRGPAAGFRPEELAADR